MQNAAPAWRASRGGRPPLPLALSALLLPAVAVWTLPQTLVGAAFALYRRLQGHKVHLYRFGPFLYLVVRARGPASSGISLGVVVFASHHSILKHELCHLITGLWLTWLYLPVYGIEYAIFGHDGSPHERLTCRLEERVSWGWQAVGDG